MAKTINFTYNGVDYTLEFTRKSIETMDKQGFNAKLLRDHPMLGLPSLFAGAFLAHHKFVKKETVDEIFGKMPNKDELLEKLAEMYNEPLEALMSDPEESEGNVEWGASW